MPCCPPGRVSGRGAGADRAPSSPPQGADPVPWRRWPARCQWAEEVPPRRRFPANAPAAPLPLPAPAPQLEISGDRRKERPRPVQSAPDMQSRRCGIPLLRNGTVSRVRPRQRPVPPKGEFSHRIYLSFQPGISQHDRAEFSASSPFAIHFGSSSQMDYDRLRRQISGGIRPPGSPGAPPLRGKRLTVQQGPCSGPPSTHADGAYPEMILRFETMDHGEDPPMRTAHLHITRPKERNS